MKGFHGLSRRTFLTAGALAVTGLAGPRVLRAAGPVEIRMRARPPGDEAWFDPLGLALEPGRTVRWILEQDVHTTTAYHPKNDLHSLRIPEGAQPWDSDMLSRKGAHFDVTFTVEGVYDYYCMPHEDMGMVGRIVVGKPGGPGALPFAYFKGKPGTAGWKPVPAAAQRAFPTVERILAQKVVRKGRA